MTLNPSAEVFVPSSHTMRLLKGPSSELEEDTAATKEEFAPPQLESLYIEFPESRERGKTLEDRSQLIPVPIDYTNFDLPFFFHDMMSADTDDFRNYLSDRAEYLLGYAGTSQMHALEIVDTILDTVFNLLRKNGREFNRPLKLAAEMCDMDSSFLQMMLQQMVRLLDYLRNPAGRDLAYSVLLGLMLSELHIGTCFAPPETALGFSEELSELYLTLLQDKRSLSAAVFALDQCSDQMRAILKPQQMDAICSMLRKISARFTSMELQSKCVQLQKKLRQLTSVQCLKAHAMPVAQLNEEESRDFEVFLQEARKNFHECL